MSAGEHRAASGLRMPVKRLVGGLWVGGGWPVGGLWVGGGWPVGGL